MLIEQPVYNSERTPPRLRKMAAGSAGFTLVELLVVVGIIAALIGILMPALAAAQRESRKTVCKGHLVQIGHGFLLYTNQYKGRYPRSPSLPSVNPYNQKVVQEYLAPFVAAGQSAAPEHVAAGTGVFEIFRCPADDTVFPVERVSYMYHQELGDRPIRETFMFQVYRDLTRVPVMWDADHFHGGGLPFNWLYADGHVEHWVQPTTQ
jgi:prepilin-type processing-associated H-X9-DG protein/prepilin-type N-terminal cleavage/methylation domain-containing protein